MKRYGDNLPSKDEEQLEGTQNQSMEVLRGGCGVRYEILDFILNLEKSKPNKRPPAFTLFRMKEEDKPAQ